MCTKHIYRAAWSVQGDVAIAASAHALAAAAVAAVAALSSACLGRCRCCCPLSSCCSVRHCCRCPCPCRCCCRCRCRCRSPALAAAAAHAPELLAQVVQSTSCHLMHRSSCCWNDGCCRLTYAATAAAAAAGTFCMQAPSCVWCTSAAVGGGCFTPEEVGG